MTESPRTGPPWTFMPDDQAITEPAPQPNEPRVANRRERRAQAVRDRRFKKSLAKAAKRYAVEESARLLALCTSSPATSEESTCH